MVITGVPTVLVVHDDVMIKSALASLIAMGGEFAVTVSVAKQASELAEDVLRLQPDAIFVSSSMALAEKASLSELVIAHPGLKVVVVSEESNWLHIFKHEDRLLTRLADLLFVIHST